MHTVPKPFGKISLILSVCSRLMSSHGVPGSGPACCDGRMVVVDSGRSKKRFSDFADFFFRWSSGDINVPPFRFLLWRTDGGGWWMVVVVVDSRKKGSRILLKILSWSSGDINVRKFGKSAKNFFYRKKIQLQLSKSGGFLIKFLMGNRCFFWKFSVFGVQFLDG